MAKQPESKHPRGEATRREIVRVARRLISEHGYRDTGISDIQAATGLTKGAFYHHFRTKEELVLAVLQAAEADYQQLFAERLSGAAGPADRMDLLLQALAHVNAQPEWCNCQMLATLAAELGATDPKLRDAIRHFHDSMVTLFRDTIAAGQASGDFRGDISADILAEWIMNTLTGALISRKLGTQKTPLSELVDNVRTVLLR
jgi:AcrR family transcriptional regulator